jgi:hypothetical protein
MTDEHKPTFEEYQQMSRASRMLRNTDTQYRLGVEDGRNSVLDDFRHTLLVEFGSALPGDQLSADVPTMILLQNIRSHMDKQRRTIANLEAAIVNRDAVDQTACNLLALAEQQHVTHSERRGMLKLAHAFLSRYIGQRKGADPIIVPRKPASVGIDTEPDDIPF